MPSVEHAVEDDRVVGVARHEEHAHVRPRGAEPLRQLAPLIPRHHHVGDEQMDGARVARAELAAPPRRRGASSTV